jgi:hypothetical protein
MQLLSVVSVTTILRLPVRVAANYLRKVSSLTTEGIDRNSLLIIDSSNTYSKNLLRISKALVIKVLDIYSL